MNSKMAWITGAGTLAVAAAAAAIVGADAGPLDGSADVGGGEPVVTVYKSPTCGCCSAWAEHMLAAGFAVETVDTDELARIKDEHGVPPTLRACHTAVVDGYVIEGHVPADIVRRFLEERPQDAAGLAVPGMPVGSPGMEVPGRPAEPYEVVTFTDDGRAAVYARR